MHAADLILALGAFDVTIRNGMATGVPLYIQTQRDLILALGALHVGASEYKVDHGPIRAGN